MRYRAFLSYSHADEKSARWLMRRLESYRVPRNLVGSPGRDGPIPAKLGQMFRDRDELPSAGDLSSTITAALNDSSALVVICSPASAKSRWVNAEVQSFRASGRGDRIYSFIIDGDPASREPGTASFPPALIEPETPGGTEREPLAADARREGDGRERAFLKLVAGLLGVGFDDLAQREAQQRHRRMAYITAASLAGMALAITLAVTAYIARNDAERRQAQAEDILGFMLGDLRKNLTKVGRLDLMRSVDDKATGYFATLDPRDLSDRALEEQARSLYGIGEVRVNEGNHKEAMIAFRESHARSTALYERAPKNGQRLFDLAQAEYWIGFVAFQQGDFENTALWFTKYRDSGIKLAGMDRHNFAWQQEEAYGYHNLAVLDESRGRYADAEKGMLRLYELYSNWIRTYPNDLQLRKDFADKISWLGSISMRQGLLQKAYEYFQELNAVYSYLLAKEPENAITKKLNLDSKQLSVDIQILLGQLNQARQLNYEAMQIADMMLRNDSKNNTVRLALGVAQFQNARLVARKKSNVFDDALTTLGVARQIEPENDTIGAWLATVQIERGRWFLKANRPADALDEVNTAHELTARFLAKSPSEHIRKCKASALILEGEIHRRMNNGGKAEAAFTQARMLLEENGGSDIPFSRLHSLVWVMHLQGQQAQAVKHRERLDKSGFVSTEPYP